MPVVELPTFHPGQLEAFWALGPHRFKALRCGRRWGKTQMAEIITCDAAAKGKYMGYFAPDYKITAEVYADIADVLRPITKSSSKVEGVVRTISKGRVDYWTLENERAGRSRKYHGIIIDEAAFTKPNMMRVWETAIRPALLDFGGWAYVLSTPNGADSNNFFWRICNEPKHGFHEFHAPTHTNPHLPVEELEKLERENHPLVFKQEYLGEFVDWSGIQFFGLENCLENGQPVEFPKRCDAVFATIDTAVKSGQEHDGVAVTYFARTNIGNHPLIVLDYDIQHLEGSLLEVWLPTVLSTLEGYARICGARVGSLGVFIEDKVSGTILIQQAQRRNLNAHAIDSKLTAMGKDERAISVSGYVYRRMVKLSRNAYDRIVVYKGQSMNHLLRQVFGYRVGQKDADDDLLDTWCYGIALALGNSEGF